ncbi:farnesol dehydrogenase-like [Ctenocephalides felis]|uniref:farnesol dehydrogenase-like n=1 Tax=Ctenocephalides felis TaxID=7515 RepID=UPI000E6E4972|nr:farnesol dehydrogenase-like [Ctenocephalides felis]
MNRWLGKVALVTGANSGIGAAVSKDLVKAGMKVVGVDLQTEFMEKNAEMLDKTKGGELHPRQCNVTMEPQVLDTFAWIKKSFGGVDVLVNNAGIIRMNMLTNPKNTDDLRAVLDVNVLGLCYFTREAFNSMKERDVSGHIIHINRVGWYSSVGTIDKLLAQQCLTGHHVGVNPEIPPTLCMYPASKFCVTALTETLRQEMVYLKNKTKITSISPGVVDTGILKTFVSEEYRAQFLEQNPHLSPEDVSEAILFCLGTSEHVQIHELTIRPVGEKF